MQKALNDNWDKIDTAIGNINTKNTNYDKEIEDIKTKNTEQDDEITKIRKEQEIQLTTVTVSTLIEKETEYTLPLKYVVGNHSLRVHWENVLLEEGEDGNYMEIGEPGTSSDKIKFGWDIEPGETLIIEVRGVLEDE